MRRRYFQGELRATPHGISQGYEPGIHHGVPVTSVDGQGRRFCAMAHDSLGRRDNLSRYCLLYRWRGARFSRSVARVAQHLVVDRARQGWYSSRRRASSRATRRCWKSSIEEPREPGRRSFRLTLDKLSDTGRVQKSPGPTPAATAATPAKANRPESRRGDADDQGHAHRGD